MADMYANTPSYDTDDPYQGLLPVIAHDPRPIVNPLKLSTAFLQAVDIDAFMELQEKVRPTLKKSYHLKPRDPEGLLRHFGERMPAIGVKTEDGALAAFALVTFLKNHDAAQNLAGYPIAKADRCTMAVTQTLCVDPALKGRGLSRMVLDAVFSIAAQNGMTQIVSAIADDNYASIRAFESAGYKAFARGFDPNHGYQKTYFRKIIGCDAA